MLTTCSLFARAVDVHVSLLSKKLEDQPPKPTHSAIIRGLG